MLILTEGSRSWISPTRRRQSRFRRSDDTDGFAALSGLRDVEVFGIDGRTYAIEVALLEDGIQIMDITDPAAPIPVSTVFDDTDGFHHFVRH